MAYPRLFEHNQMPSPAQPGTLNGKILKPRVHHAESWPQHTMSSACGLGW